MDADDDEFITANNDGYGLEDDDILTRWEEMLPPGIGFKYIRVSVIVPADTVDIIYYCFYKLIGVVFNLRFTEHFMSSSVLLYV